MPPTVAQVQSALKQVDPASSLRSTALRSLKAWQQHHPEIGVTDEAVNLWLALKGLVGRVTPARHHVVLAEAKGLGGCKSADAPSSG